VYEIVKNGAFLQFANKGYATEKEHLKEMAKDEKIALRDSIIAMLNEGKTQKQAAAELGLSQSKVSRLLKK
jgi:DNA-directed RNA polymerase specialized sigma subunit